MTMVAPPDEPGDDRGIEHFTTNEFDIELIPDGDSFKVVASGVAKALGHADGRDLSRSIPEDEKGSEIVPTPGGHQRVLVLLEPGFYRAIGQRQAARVRNPEIRAQVERFQNWVYHEVLPSLRKHGRYEVIPTPQPRELSTSLGLQPPKMQAELLVTLGPFLPGPYVTAAAKIIVARAMGERPELLPAETPLYAATFLAEKGHRKATVAKFQSGFGQRVSNLYFKVHGRRPEKIPGPAGSRIDKVAVYTEDDRSLLEQVYAGMVDVVRAFESGGQHELSA